MTARRAKLDLAALSALLGRRHARFRKVLAGAIADQSIAHVHRSRVEARGLRSVLGTLRPLANARRIEACRRDLRGVALDLEAVREADVRRDWLLELAGELDSLPPGSHRHLALALEQARGAARARLSEQVATKSWEQRLARVAATLADPGLLSRRRAAHDDLARQVRALLARRWRKLRRRLESADRDPEALHELRLAVKHARYASHALLPLLGIDPRPFLKPLKALQDCLGDHHDAVLARAWLEGLAQPEGPVLLRRLDAPLAARMDRRVHELKALRRKLGVPRL